MPIPLILVLITTSNNRWSKLREAISSVAGQTHQPDAVLVVGDYEQGQDGEAADIEKLLFRDFGEKGRYTNNKRTLHHSGTGSWNTGIVEYARDYPGHSFVAILDDDDTWHPLYLEKIAQAIEERHKLTGSLPLAVFAGLKRTDLPEALTPGQTDLTPRSFLIGNPGVQGSNMVFQLKELIGNGGFDEDMESCTDRDLMIRFTSRESYRSYSIITIPDVLVTHNAGPETLTYDRQKKRKGLDAFFEKHVRRFRDKETLDISLRRAERLFGYEGREGVVSKRKERRIVVVTGGYGFIGHHLCKKLYDAGYEVVIWERSARAEEESGECTLSRDMNKWLGKEEGLYAYDPEGLHGATPFGELREVKAVVHLAGTPRVGFSLDYPKESESNNVGFSKKVATVAKELGAGTVVFASSSSVYGEMRQRGTGGEVEPGPMSPYARQKLTAEKEMQAALETSPVKLAVLRLFSVYGEDKSFSNYGTLIHNWVVSAIRREPLRLNGDGEKRRDFTYVGDVCEAILCVLRNAERLPKSAVYDIGRGESVRISDVAKMIGHEYQLKTSVEIKPDRQCEPQQTLADTSAARRDLGWCAKTDLRSGLALTRHLATDDEIIVICVAYHNNASTIGRCLDSIINQKNVRRKVFIELLDDNSDRSERLADILSEKSGYMSQDITGCAFRRYGDGVRVGMRLSLTDSKGCIPHTRNELFSKATDGFKAWERYQTEAKEPEDLLWRRRHFVRLCPDNRDADFWGLYLPSDAPIALLGRLDADDYLASDLVLAEIEKILDERRPDIILCGNAQRGADGETIGINRATPRLMKTDYLETRLRQMVAGEMSAELPSCGLFVAPGALHHFPDIASAEDHGLLLYYLTHQDNYKIVTAEDIIAINYGINGAATGKAIKSKQYIEAREKLLEDFICATRQGKK